MRTKILGRYAELYPHGRIHQPNAAMKTRRLLPYTQQHYTRAKRAAGINSITTETQTPHVRYLIYSTLTALAIDLIIIGLFAILLEFFY